MGTGTGVMKTKAVWVVLLIDAFDIVEYYIDNN